MTHYFQGDQPAEPVVVVPARDGDLVDLELYSEAGAWLLDGAGTTTLATATIVIPPDDAIDDEPHVAVQLPKLDAAGLSLLTIKLVAAGGAFDTFEADPVVVDRRDGWHSLSSARIEWETARNLDDARLYVLLETARTECMAFLPAKRRDGIAAGLERPTVGYREAQLLHARNRNAAARVDPASGEGGTDGYSLSPYPLDWTVKQLLRPSRRLGRVR